MCTHSGVDWFLFIYDASSCSSPVWVAPSFLRSLHSQKRLNLCNNPPTWGFLCSSLIISSWTARSHHRTVWACLWLRRWSILTFREAALPALDASWSSFSISPSVGNGEDLDSVGSRIVAFLHSCWTLEPTWKVLRRTTVLLLTVSAGSVTHFQAKIKITGQIYFSSNKTAVNFDSLDFYWKLNLKSKRSNLLSLIVDLTAILITNKK